MVLFEESVEALNEYTPQQTQVLAAAGDVGECSCVFALALANPASGPCSLATDSIGMPMLCLAVPPSHADVIYVMEYQPQLGAVVWAAQPDPMMWPTRSHPGSGEKGQLEWNHMVGSTQEQPLQPCGPCNANPQLDGAFPSRSSGSTRMAPTRMNSLQADLKSGSEARRNALNALLEKGTVHELSFHKVGCRLVQLALDLVDRREAATLARDLRGSVVKAVQCPHANYVIQKILAVLSPREVPFVVAEISEASPYDLYDLACHEYGCRIFCRLLEQNTSDVATSHLVDELLWYTDDLAQDVYGHHVIECVLEHGLAHQRSWIVSALHCKLWQHAWSRYGAYVLVKALDCGDQEQQEALAWGLLAWGPDSLAALAVDQYGNLIVRALMENLPETFVHALGCSLGRPVAQARLMKSKLGKRLRADLRARFAA